MRLTKTLRSIPASAGQPQVADDQVENHAVYRSECGAAIAVYWHGAVSAEV